jgi:hypothetical protein
MFGIDRARIGIEFKDRIRFFEYMDKNWDRMYQRENLRTNSGKIVGNYDFSPPKDSKVIFSQGYEVWLRNSSEISVLGYNHTKSDSKWEPKIITDYNGYKNQEPKNFYDLTFFNNYNFLFFWDFYSEVGAIQNLKLEFFKITGVDDQSYLKTFKLIPNSNFTLPEGFSGVFGAGRDSIGIVINNKIKIYSAILQKDGYGHIIKWDGWEYLDYMDFDLSGN